MSLYLSEVETPGCSMYSKNMSISAGYLWLTSGRYLSMPSRTILTARNGVN